MGDGTGLDKVGHVGKIEKCKERARRGLETPLKQRLNFLANVAMIISWVGMGLLMSWDRTNPWRLTSTSHFLWISLLCYLIKKLGGSILTCVGGKRIVFF